MYPEYPDLVVFHVYGGEGGEYEEILKNIRKYTTAEVLCWTHHLDSCKQFKYRESASALRRALAKKYDCELADVRERWKEYINKNGVSVQSLLRDQIHPNSKGGTLLGEMLVQHFTPKPIPESRKKWITTLDLSKKNKFVNYDQTAWIIKDGGLVNTVPGKPLKITFTGNKVDIVALPIAGSGGKSKILLDGKDPSKLADNFAVTRSTKAPGAWWPMIKRFKVGKNAVKENWSIKYYDIPKDGSSFKFEVVGSVSGLDGNGKSGDDFTSKSGRIGFAAENEFRGVKKYLRKDLPATFTAKCKTYSMSKSSWSMPKSFKPGQVAKSKVIQLWSSGKHTLEIIPENAGVAIKEIIVHNPPLSGCQ